MSSRYCQDCGTFLIATADRCSLCGREYPPTDDDTSRNSEKIRRQRDANNDVWWGIAICIVFGGIALGTFIYAEPGSSFYILWGPILYGVYRILKGVL